MAQPQGEAAGYYNEQPQPGYQAQQSQEMKSGYAPPTYGQDFHMPQDNKQSFEQTFKVEKPKLNDLWAGILVSWAGHKARYGFVSSLLRCFVASLLRCFVASSPR
jgi:hypothetical protein